MSLTGKILINYVYDLMPFFSRLELINYFPVKDIWQEIDKNGNFEENPYGNL